MEREPCEIIADFKRGRTEAFEEIVERYQDRLFHLFIHFVKNRQDAEDLLQEAFIRMLKGIHSYDHRQKFDAWIFTIANHLACDFLRRRKKNWIFYSADMQNFETEPQDVESKPETYDCIVQDMLQCLPWEQRQIFLLREEAGLSFREIADMLGISINTALGRMHYAVVKLRAQLKELPEEGENSV
jgi:RNA polymerase sigma-70 factor (ECF subfamily)